MHVTLRQSCRGFTVIESIIYVGLTAFLLTSVLGATYPLLTGAGRTSDRITADGESVFVVRKVAWAMSSVTSVTEPSAGTSGTTLTTVGANGTYTFTLSGGVVQLSVDGGTAVPLTASRVSVTNLAFTHVAPAAGAPRAVELAFDMNGGHVGPLRFYARY